MASGVVVIDPGHGGAFEVGGSSANNAVSPSGVLEKNIALRMGFLLRDALLQIAARELHDLAVFMTRDTDVNVGLAERAGVAKANGADVFLSIHLNASEGHNARGVETLIRPKAAGNTNHEQDKAFATRVQRAVVGAMRNHDANTRDRGVKDQVLGVLKDQNLGPGVAACLVEIEFIDVPAVDTLLNIGPRAPAVRADIAAAIARAIVEELESASE